MKVKDKTVTEHQHNYANYANIMLKCPENQCSEDYPGKIARE